MLHIESIVCRIMSVVQESIDLLRLFRTGIGPDVRSAAAGVWPRICSMPVIYVVNRHTGDRV